VWPGPTGYVKIPAIPLSEGGTDRKDPEMTVRPDRIVVPLDESAFSESALPIAEQLALALDAEIDLLAAGWGSNVVELQTYLDERRAPLRPATSTIVAPDTFPATAIADALSGDGDIVVMATHGRSGIGRALLGSVAEDVLQRSDHPAVLLGPNADPTRAIAGAPLAMTTDGSPLSAMVLPRVATWARALGMPVIVIGVVAGGGTPLGGGDRDSLDTAMASAVTFLTAEGVEASAAVLIGAEADRAVVEWLRADDVGATVGLVAMTSHGRGGIARTALGSTAMKIVHDSPAPTLVQRLRR